MKSLKETINELLSTFVYAKLVECYNTDNDIVFLAAIAEHGSDKEAIKKVKTRYPKFDIISISDIDGKIDLGDLTSAQYDLVKEGVIMLDEPVHDVTLL